MQTNNAVVAVIGLDEPGIIACVSSVLTPLGCNIEEMTQSTLHQQFACIYLINKPLTLTNDALTQAIDQACRANQFNLTVVTRDFVEATESSGPLEPFVVSVYGPDRNDIVGAFAQIFGEHGINIEGLRAFPIGEGSSMQVFEVMVPASLDTRTLHRLMLERANLLGLNLTMQHRDIFEAVHRVAVV